MLFKRPPVDMLYPTGDGKNRDEYFLVEFDDIVISRVEQVFYGLLQLPGLRKRFSGLDSFSIIDPTKFYYDYAILSPEQFLYEMDPEHQVPMEEYPAIIDECMTIDTWNYCSKTMMLYAIINLVDHQYLKRVDFISPRKIYPREFLHVHSLVKEAHEKLNFLYGDIKAAIKDHPEYTTIMTNSSQLVVELLKNYDTYHLDQTLLLIRNNFNNMTAVPSTVDPNQIDHWNESDNDLIRELSDHTRCKVGRFYPTLYTDPQVEGAIFGKPVERSQSSNG